jgi:hypothetical protein
VGECILLSSHSLQLNCFYYQSIKRKLNRRLICECRCDERLKLKLRELHASHTPGVTERFPKDLQYQCYTVRVLFVYYESLKGALKTKTIYGYRCDERLKTNIPGIEPWSLPWNAY